MSTPSDQTFFFQEQAEAILHEGRFQNFVAQSHSRDVLRHLRVPPEQWPDYTDTLDEDLVYAAQTLLYLGLRLKLESSDPADGESYLTRGAEILEHVYARSDNSDPERVYQMFTAALAYYMAGHFARAFVLVRDIEAEAPLPRFLRPIRHLLLKEFRPLRGVVLEHLLRAEYDDAEIAAAVMAGQLDEDQALCRILEATLYRALSYFLEHARTGDQALLSAAEELAEGGTEVAVAHKFADWWWYFSCVRVQLKTFRRHSLWTNLDPLFSRPETATLARRYVHANLHLPTPVIELWPSQVTAVPYLFGENPVKNLCLRMPTSAGKTKVAELAILTHVKGGMIDPKFKCVYVAPFRSLAVEVEQTLRQALLPLGLRVSELYGGFELTAADRLLIEKTHVLVATPEKLDAFVRFSPELARQIRLVILDEGHIISPPNFKVLRKARGLKYEVFLQRLVTRCSRSGARIVFLSAVMPNAEQFAEWITGDPDGLVSSDWRPSRLMLGEVVWTGTAVDLEFTHADRKPLGHRCFVRSFVTRREASSLQIKGRKNPFPHNDAEALAVTALEFARHKLTMVFVARKTSAEPFGRTLLKCIELRRKIAEAEGQGYRLLIDPAHQSDLERCIALVRENMGEASEHIGFLREGFVVHHSGLPQPVRIALEKLVRSGAVRLVVATTTLAQGVNFPIHTVLVHSLDHGQEDPVSPMDFWNICGRAGRGMKENEGQVLFFVRQCFEEWQKGKPENFRKQPVRWQQQKWREWCAQQRDRRLAYLDQYGTYQVESGLLSLLRQVVRLWKEKHPSVNVPGLCEALANHRLDLFASSDKVDLESLLSTLDGLLIAMTEECDAEEITADTFQALLCRSLVHLQLASENKRQTVNRLLAARVRYIRGRFPDQTQRRRFYQLGLPLRDCESIEAARDELLALYLQAARYATWTALRRADHLADIAGRLFLLSETAPTVEVPACWRRILELWLDGQTPTAILTDPLVAAEEITAHQLNRWIDDVFAYRLPWGFNSLAVYLKQYAEITGAAWPHVCDYYSSFLKYGVHEPAACWLLALGVPSRALASRLGRMLGDRVDSPESLLLWLRSGGIAQLAGEGLDDAEAEMLQAAALREGSPQARRSPGVTLHLGADTITGPLPAPGTRVLVEPMPGGAPDEYRLLTLSGKLIRRFRISSERLARLMANPEFATAEIIAPRQAGEAERLHLRVEAI
jgi:superfamily II DNA/RNA helicase